MSTPLDAQFGFKAETSYGTAVTVTNFMEFASENIRPEYQLLTGSGFRPGAHAIRSDRTARNGMIGCSGSVTWQPLAAGGSGLSALLAPALGAVTTSGPTTSSYTHTGTFGDLAGDSLTIQVGRPGTAGTVHPFTYAGCKVGGLTLRNSLDGILEASLDIAHALSETTGIALASASYTASTELYSWSDGGLTVAGSTVNISDVSFSLRNPYRLRRYVGGTQGEPLQNGLREATCTFTMEFEDLTELNYVRATTVAAGQKKLVATWTGNTAISASTYPQIIVTFEVSEITGDYVAQNGMEINTLTVNAIARFDGTNSPMKIEVISADSTP